MLNILVDLELTLILWTMEEPESLDWLKELLEETQLQKFFTSIHDSLHLSRLEHFDFVKSDDLEKIGMGRPAVRRLMDAVKRRRRRTFLERVSASFVLRSIFLPFKACKEKGKNQYSA